MNKVGSVDPDSVELGRLLSRINTETTVLRETGHKRPHTVRLHVPPRKGKYVERKWLEPQETGSEGSRKYSKTDGYSSKCTESHRITYLP